jgi:hypothetical protein
MTFWKAATTEQKLAQIDGGIECGMKPFGELSDAEKGALLLAHHEGKRIQFYSKVWVKWCDCIKTPLWDDRYLYRIAPEPLTPESINWEHVSPEYNFMARDEKGTAYLFRVRPHICGNAWYYYADDDCRNVGSHASYRRGTVGWKDSLVIRPGYEAILSET